MAVPVTIGDIQISNSTVWVDESNDAPVAQSVEYAQDSGRPIIYADKKDDLVMTLVSHGCTMAMYKALNELKKQPGLQMTTVLRDGRTFQTVFAHESPPVLVCRRLVETTTYTDSDICELTIKLRVI